MSLLDDKGLKYFVGKLKDMFAPKNHTHDGRYYTESEIDGKLSGKANSSHTHTKAQVGLGNVDNTADSAKSVKAATKLQTYKQGSTTATYGDSYPLYAQWSGDDVVLKCDNYKVKVSYAGSAGSAGSATNDSKKQAITGYIRGLSVSGRTVTYTRGDGTTGSITTQDTNTTYGNMTGATANAAGKAGLVPAPAAGTQGSKYLRADGTWQTPPDTNTTYGNASQSANGLMSAADKKKLDGIANGANNFTYSLPTASATVLGGVKTGSNITNTSGVLSLTKANVTSALGYTPPTTNTTYGNATTSSSGLMSSSDKSKLDGIATGANKTVVDGSLSVTSTNPVQNAVVTKGMQFLYKCVISRDAWNEASDKSSWNVIVNVTKPTTTISGIPDLTTDMKLSPPMMERAASITDNKILTGELSMINCGNISINATNKISLIIEKRPVCDVVLYFYGRK